MIRNVSYSQEAYGDIQVQIERAAVALEGVDYDTMIGTGLSGAVIIPELARALGKHWAIIRKRNDGSHASQPFEGEIGNKWIFVDDFISTGATRSRVIDVVNEISREFGQAAEYVGDYEYSRGAERSGRYTPPRDRASWW